MRCLTRLRAQILSSFVLMTAFAVSCATCAFASASPASRSGIAAPAHDVLELETGQSLLLKFPKTKRVAVADSQMVDVKVFDDTQDILLLGRSPGLTDLRIWAHDGSTLHYLIRVAGPEKSSPVPAAPAPPASTILIKAQLIEVKKTALRDIGVDWTDVAAGPVFGSLDELVTNDHFRLLPESARVPNLPLDLGSSNHYFGWTTVVESVVRLLVENGSARVLAEPTLTCIDGGQADFLVGGEVPIPVQNQDGALNVVFKQFGVILGIAPRAQSEGLIRTRLNVELSSLDKASSVLGIPGFATRKTTTEMNVRSGDTMVVAGLFSAEDAKTVSKMPGLGSIPILGELFKSRQFRRGATELVVLVTPQLISPASAEVEAAVRRYRELDAEAREDLRPKIND